MRVSAGQGVDIFGAPVIDPTKNVLDLVTAAIKRIDDLQATADKYHGVIRGLERELRDLENKRQDELRCAGDKHQEALRTQSDQRHAAVAGEIEKFEKRISEILRTQVESTSQLISTQLVQLTANIKEMIAELSKRIALVEQFRWESGGRSQSTAVIVGLIFSSIMAVGSFSGLIIILTRQ